MTAATDLILHHYPRSPFAEKIRIAFGVKRLRWRSVMQPRMAPKPDLVPLTGGYRRIPVLQIGADVYCDTRRIIAELERRFPEPSLYPQNTRAPAEAVAAWADRDLFATALGLVFGLHGDRFPPELHADRAAFTAGQFDGWDSIKMRAQLPALRDDFRRYLAQLDHDLHDGRRFLLGDAVSLADLAAYHPLWYARGNLGDGEGLAEYPRLITWLDRMAAIGHGEFQEISTLEALDVARQAQPAPPFDSSSDHDGGWAVASTVSVTPVDWGFDAVTGSIVSASPDSIALHRDDPDLGAIAVHFPRAGFDIVEL